MSFHIYTLSLLDDTLPRDNPRQQRFSLIYSNGHDALDASRDADSLATNDFAEDDSVHSVIVNAENVKAQNATVAGATPAAAKDKDAKGTKDESERLAVGERGLVPFIDLPPSIFLSKQNVRFPVSSF